MSYLLDTLDTLDAAAIASAGNVSESIRTRGMHLATVTEALTAVGTAASGTSYEYMLISFTTPGGNAEMRSFKSTPKDPNDPALVEKSNRANKRDLDNVARLAKAAGLKDIKAALANAQSGTDAKGNAATIFPKLIGKKVNIAIFTEISAEDKDATKVYAKQTIDPYKFLSTEGTDALGRNRLDAFQEEMENRIEIFYKDDKNPACIQKLAQLKEAALPTAAPAPTQDAPATTVAQSAATDIDI